MENDITSKIKTNLLNLGNNDYKKIAENDELKELLNQEIIQGKSFDASELIEYINIWTDSRIIIPFLERLRQTSFSDYLSVISIDYNNPNVIDELSLSKEATDILLKCSNEQIMEIINFIIDNPNSKELRNFEISNFTNPLIIQELMKRKYYNMIEFIYDLDIVPDSELEKYIIESLDHYTKQRLYCFSDNIFKKCQEIKRLDLIINMQSDILNNPNYIKAIIEAIKNGDFNYKGILNKKLYDVLIKDDEVHFLLLREKLLYIAKNTRSFHHLDDEDKEYIKSNKDLINITIDLIKEHINNGGEIYPWSSLYIDEPSIIYTIYAYDFEYLKRAIEDVTNVTFGLLKDLKKCPDLSKAIRFNLQNHIDQAMEVRILNVGTIPNDIIIEFLKFYTIPQLTEYWGYQAMYNKEHIDEVTALITNLLKTHTPAPGTEDIKFDSSLPSCLLELIIPYLTKEQLKPTYIPLDKNIENVKLLEILFKRLKELKSNSYNSYLATISYVDSKVIHDIILDPENPLNLSIAQLHSYIGNFNTTNINYIANIIKTKDVLTTLDLQNYLSYTDQTEGTEKLFKEILYKVPIDNTFYEILGIFLSRNKNEIMYSIIKDFVIKQKNVPPMVTQYLGNDIIERNSLADLPDEYLLDSKFFKDVSAKPAKELIKEFLMKSLDKGKTVCIDLLDIFKLPNSYYNYENVSLEPVTLNRIINHLISDKNCGPIIRRWLSTATPSDIAKVNFSDFVILCTEYTEELLANLEKNKDNMDVVLIENLCISITMSSLNSEHLNKFMSIISDYVIKNKNNLRIPPTYNYNNEILFTTDNEFIISYIKECIDSCLLYRMRTIIQNQANLFKNDIYVKYLIEGIEKNNITIDYSFINSISLSNQDFKSFIIKLITENRLTFVNYINVNDTYLDKDIFYAIMNNPNIKDDCKRPIIVDIIHRIGNGSECEFDERCIDVLINNVSKIYQIKNENYLKKITKQINLEWLVLIQNEKFVALLNKGEEYGDKFFEIFKNREIKLSMVEGVVDSLKQNLFTREKKDVIEFFSTALAWIQKGITEEEKQEIINTLYIFVPEELEDDIKALNDDKLLSLYNNDKHSFLEYLIGLLSIDQNKYVNIFHIITTNYITQERINYRKNNNIYEDTTIEMCYEEKSLLTQIVNFIIYKMRIGLGELKYYNIPNTELNIMTIIYLKNPEEVSKNLNKDQLINIKKNIKNIKRMLEISAREIYKLNSYSEIKESTLNSGDNLSDLLHWDEFKPYLDKVKTFPILPSNANSLQQATNGLNFDILMDTILEDEDKYNCLIGMLNKYSFLNWGKLFSPTVEKLTLGEDGNSLINFINGFSKIYDAEYQRSLQERKTKIKAIIEKMVSEGKSQEEIDKFIQSESNKPLIITISPYKIMNYCVIFSSVANCYKILLGLEDFSFIKTNPSPNSSSSPIEERLEYDTKMQLDMYRLQDVSIPSFIHEYKFSDDRKLNIIIGNRNDSRNLTHGERTGACMRAYGAGFSLFNFCNTDYRGFHFTIVDPDTGEYISRVSGFRNGNTVFLNQLRYSLNPNKYSNEDLIQACKSAAEEIIKRSREDEFGKPIENVVISTGYAVESHFQETQELSETNIGKGVYDGYRDVGNRAYVMATTGKDNIPTPLDLYSDQPHYLPVRLPIKKYNQEEINNNIKILIQRISAIKKCLNSEDIEFYHTIDIDLELLEKEFLYVIIGEDFFVALDENYNISSELIEIDPRAKKEYDEAIQEIETIKNKYTKGDTTYGK